jgi:adenosylhomocysteine nucleosidase
VSSRLPEELLAAILDADRARVRTILDSSPELAAARGPDGITVRLAALYRGQNEIAAMLANTGPPLDLFEAAALGRADRVTECVGEDSASVRAFTSDGWTALHLAAFFGQEASVDRLLDAGAPLDAVSRNDLANQPLHAATANGQVGVARRLIARGAPLEFRSHGGTTPLHLAAENGNESLVELLLSSGADPRVASDTGATAEVYARRSGHRELADRLQAAAASRPTS